ncbi:MAG: hypothetical protein KDK66_04740 [Deltaproteobacteria bacterium]|nr:hypothetical protein [Deltaproteobacteria bacterium]
MATILALAACGSATSLEGYTFYSRSSKKWVGLGPEGPAYGYWSFVFRESDFSWYHSDLGSGGSYFLPSENQLRLSFESFFQPEPGEFVLELNESQTEFVFEGTTYIREDVHEGD